jgi:hypothetical protein
MQDEFSLEARNTIHALANAWENEDIPQTFEAVISDDGNVRAMRLHPMNQGALNELVKKDLIRITEGKQEGELSIKLMPSLQRVVNDVRAADKARERQYHANYRRIITG